MRDSRGKRAVSALSLGVVGTLLLVIARPAGHVPALRDVPAWLSRTSADEAVLTVTWALGWVTVAWLTAVALLAAGAAIPGAIGLAARLLLRLIAPRAMRRTIEVALGLSLAAGPLFGGVASAAAPPAAPHGLEMTVPSLDRPMNPIPALDRPQQRHAAARPALATTAGPSLDRPTAKRPVTVTRGDSLWLIASRGLGHDAGNAQIAEEWPRWWAANRAVIGDNPDLIQPGQHLEPPRSPDPQS